MVVFTAATTSPGLERTNVFHMYMSGRCAVAATDADVADVDDDAGFR